ncbi:hypothetical protein GGU11DRAFT_743396 [Lentinula aff. detonsa]|nr:hypothetical protein GGU11DRAFT_743396 [Lentinula aff. detonsa]
MVRITLLVLATFIGASAHASPIAYRPAGRRAFAGNSVEPSHGDLGRRAFAGGHGEPLKEDLDKRAFASNGSEPSQGGLD